MERVRLYHDSDTFSDAANVTYVITLCVRADVAQKCQYDTDSGSVGTGY